MRKISLLWYGILIGAYSLQAKDNQENFEKQEKLKTIFSWTADFSNVTKDTRKDDGKTDDDLCDTNELILPENAISWVCTEKKTIKNKVYRGGRCELQCKEYFKRVVGQSINFKVKVSSNKLSQ